MDERLITEGKMRVMDVRAGDVIRSHDRTWFRVSRVFQHRGDPNAPIDLWWRPGAYRPEWTLDPVALVDVQFTADTA